MLENPENIYDWAKKFLVLKSSDQEQDVSDKFWNKIEEYLNYYEDEDDINDKDDIQTGENNNDFDDDSLEDNNLLIDENGKIQTTDLYNRKQY
ncbi:MAG: hypothetical protein WAW59_02105 [Patescibacteria group bacterium]